MLPQDEHGAKKRRHAQRIPAKQQEEKNGPRQKWSNKTEEEKEDTTDRDEDGAELFGGVKVT